MKTSEKHEAAGHRLIQFGVILFLAGLLTGFAMPVFSNPRMGLSSHLEGILNGTFLIVIGLIWARLRMGDGARRITLGFVLYGTFANWFTTLISAIWGVGAGMMPIAGGGLQGSPAQELLVTALLLSLSFAMIATCVMVLWGLRGNLGVLEPALGPETLAPGK